jgi:hypothetical protein
MFNNAFDGLGIMFILMFVLIAGLGIYAIPSNKNMEVVKFKIKDKIYKCPKGFKIDDNLTCYKKYKAVLLK